MPDSLTFADSVRQEDVPRTIDHYEIEAVLGRGGMGVVYRARDTRLGRTLALKVLSPEWTADAERRNRLLREARVAAAVNHPALAQIYDVGEESGVVFIAMELVEGRTVQALIRGQEIDVHGAIEIAIQIAGGLAKAHEAGIVHRDVKPSNVMVTPDGYAKLLDFGLAKRTASSERNDIADLATLSKTGAGVVVGTIDYMSPEQARGLPLDGRSDIFSLGVLLYEMLAGRSPFHRDAAIDTLHAIGFDEPLPMASVRTGVPPQLEAVLLRCLRKSHEDRYPDCGALVVDLKRVRRETDSGASSVPILFQKLEARLRFLSSLTTRERAIGALAAVSLAAAAIALADGVSRNGFLLLTLASLLAWRRLRHRRQRLARRFARKAGQLPEVRLVVQDGPKLIVATTGAVARTYVRLRALVDGVNASLFFGEPFDLVVRDGVPADAVQSLLATSGVLYVREERRALPP